jgi:hypothetical protein
VLEAYRYDRSYSRSSVHLSVWQRTYVSATTAAIPAAAAITAASLPSKTAALHHSSFGDVTKPLQTITSSAFSFVIIIRVGTFLLIYYTIPSIYLIHLSTCPFLSYLGLLRLPPPAPGLGSPGSSYTPRAPD